MRWSLLLLLALALPACRKPTRQEPAPLDPFGELTTSSHGGETPPERHVGFSEDDRYLGYEIAPCEGCPTTFTLEAASGPPLHVGLGEADGAARLPKGGGSRVLRGPFPYPDLVFATASALEEAAGTVMLRFGAHLPNEAPVFPLAIVLGPHPRGERMGEPVLAYANVTKDGSEIGAVAIARGGSSVEFGGAARMKTAQFAAKVYAETGLRHHRRNDLKRAVVLFEKADQAFPENALHTYNLACAYARLGDARAQATLERAVARGGDAIAERAAKDPDFERVRGAAWFAKYRR